MRARRMSWILILREDGSGSEKGLENQTRAGGSELKIGPQR